MPHAVRDATVSSLARALAFAGTLAVFVIAGCSGSGQTAAVDVRYDDRQDSTAYQAGPVSITPSSNPQMQNEASVTNQRRRRGRRGRRGRRRQRRQADMGPSRTVVLNAYARCGGRECTPTEVDVTFRADQRVVRPGSPLTMQMSGRTYNWEQPRVESPVPGGAENIVATVTMSWTQFQELAQSEIVALTLGDLELESEYEDRAALRKLSDRAGLR